MSCRIGITTNPNRRKQEWKKIHPSLTNWQILAKADTKSEAQEQETKLAHKYGCEAHQGGDDPDSHIVIWYVYYFKY